MLRATGSAAAVLGGSGGVAAAAAVSTAVRSGAVAGAFAASAAVRRGVKSSVAAANAQPAKEEAAVAAAPQLVTLSIDGKDVSVPEGSTLIQACEMVGVDVPRFCYHERLSIAGNCRMCLVEVQKMPKPAASCALNVMPGMVVMTDTPKVKKAREGVMEFLLANHPLDCPICDQAGECDLQDQAMVYGNDRSRFNEMKRAVEDKNIGPIVKMIMTRCIHCTRCVRFASEVAGVEDLGMTGRGNESQIGTYISKMWGSELSGNVVDLCPVGALTSKPTAFNARSWELKNTESVDVLDALGTNITISSRGNEVMRLLPRLNEDVNEEWMSDKSRYAFDGLKRQRLVSPMINHEVVSWEAALEATASALSGAKHGSIRAVAGRFADAEAMVALKDLVNKLGSTDTRYETENAVSADLRTSYLFNAGVAGIEEADQLLIIGSNPRTECPVLNARIRKAHLHTGLEHIGHIGPSGDFTFPYEHLGLTPSSLAAVADGTHPYASVFAQAKRPMVLVGSGVLARDDVADVMAGVASLADTFPNLVSEGWNGISMLHTDAARVGANDVGFVPGPTAAPADKPAEVYFLLGADEYDLAAIPDDATVIYQGHTGDAGATRADIILPAAAYTEKTATYVNTEGRAQRTRKSVGVPGSSREDWKIVRALSEVMGKTLPYDTREQMRDRIGDVAPHLTVSVDEVARETPALARLALKTLAAGGSVAKAAAVPFASPVDNFFQTDAISRNSPVMARCTIDGVTRSPTFATTSRFDE